MVEKEILKAVWRLQFLKGSARREDLRKEVAVPGLDEVLAALIAKGSLELAGDVYRLTEKGRGAIKVVVCTGVFDLLHPGHVFILWRAREYGDLLAVVVARDATVRRRKRVPIVPEEQRVEMVGHLKPVDLAVLGKEWDYLSIVEELRPDVIVLGPDQSHDPDAIKRDLRERGLEVEVVRIGETKECSLCSTRSIIRRVREMDKGEMGYL